MKPALSVIVFTVLSGAGLGALALSALAVLTAPLLNAAQQPVPVLHGVLAGLVLTAIGLLASTLHLANKKNAWRAFSRFRTSWLSREAVLAVALYPVAAALAWRLWSGDGAFGTGLLALATAALALATLFATGMIYAVLRTIPQWNNALVPVNYIVLGLASGAALLQLLAAARGDLGAGLPLTVGGLLLLAAMTKATYYFWIGSPSGSTINTATGASRAGVKLLDIGHSGPTFHTKECGFQVVAARLKWLRAGVFALLFVLPLTLSLLLWDRVGETTPAVVPAALILLSALAGLLLERWLFFAEARHSVTLFHGRQRL